MNKAIFAAAGLLLASVPASADVPPPSLASTEEIVAALDTKFQAAVKANDATTIDKIVADDFVLVTGKGKIHGKADLLKDAREKTDTYEHQEDSQRTVRVFGDMAIVTALLWVKGMEASKPFEYKLWFSDIYQKRPEGWRYIFGQAAQPL